MAPSRETLLTATFAAACVVLLAAAWGPRWLARGATPLRVEGTALTVAVDGAVARPGRFELPWGARVADLLDAAGGPTAGADTALIDPAQPLVDGQRVWVPRAGAPEGDARVSLNRASTEALQALPGIGPALARRIEQARPFGRVDDLRAVQGIGPATMKDLRPRVTL